MRLYELKKALGELITPLVLDSPDIKSLPVESLKAIKVAIEESRADFEEIIDQAAGTSHNMYYLKEVVNQLHGYQNWFYDNYVAMTMMLCGEDATDAVKAQIVKEISDQIDIFWLEPVKELVDGFKETQVSPKKDVYSEKKSILDPKGYGRASEHYVSMIYVVKESPNYPGIAQEEVYTRIKSIIKTLGPSRGVRISRFLAFAYLLGFLKEWPQHKALQREMGVTCSSPAIKKLSDNIDEDENKLIGKIESWLSDAIGVLTANGPVTS